VSIGARFLSSAHAVEDIMHTRWILTAVIAVALFGCSGSEPAPAPQPEAPAPAAQAAPVAAPTPPPAAPVVATPDGEGIVRLGSNDQMRFTANRIEVKAGEKIKIELHNAGTLPKEAMGHNLIVLKAGIEPSAFAAKAMSAKATDYVPADAAADVIGHTKLLGPGEKAVLELEPLAAGTYPFLCSFPGHVALMNGQLVVQ
jgi:azurin